MRLELLAQLAAEGGADRLAVDARALCERIRDGLFYVACVGQFKRGKSTLLNALLGDRVLPVGVTPVTAVVTVVRHGPRPLARIRFAAGDWQEIATSDLPLFVTEEHNPENARGVAGVEVFFPSALLSSGMCLVDTPGIGSVFTGNTEAARAFVPHVDAALVVLGADPPISADELSLVEEIARQCNELLFILNKADKLADDEREKAVVFTRGVLADRAGLDDVRLFSVSATEHLLGRRATRDWAELTGALERLAHESGSDLLRAAEEREQSLLARRLRYHLDQQKDALLSPVQDSERRIEMLRTCVAEAEQSMNDLGFLFKAEQKRLSRVFERKTEEFLEAAQPEARREFADALLAADVARGPAMRTLAVELAYEVSQRWLDRWLSEARPVAEGLYLEATRRFVDLANSFLDKLGGSGDAAFAALPRAVAPETGFRVQSNLFYTSLMSQSGQTLGGWVLDVVSTRAGQLRRLERRVGQYLETIVFTNANRIKNDFDERVLESSRRLQSDIRTSIASVVMLAEAALDKAMALRAQGSLAVQAELQRIESLSDRLQTVVC